MAFLYPTSTLLLSFYTNPSHHRLHSHPLYLTRVLFPRTSSHLGTAFTLTWVPMEFPNATRHLLVLVVVLRVMRSFGLITGGLGMGSISPYKYEKMLISFVTM